MYSHHRVCNYYCASILLLCFNDQLTSASAPSTPGLEVRYAATGERLAQDLDGLRGLSSIKGRDSSEYPFQIEPITEDGLEDANFIEFEGEVFDEDSSGGEGGDPKCECLQSTNVCLCSVEY